MGEDVDFVGGCHAILGDLPGQAKLAGTKSGMADDGTDRALDIPKNDSYKEFTQTQVNQMMRNVPQTYVGLQKWLVFRNYGTQAEADAELDKVRLARVSCFWKLEIFRKKIFLRFGFCRLHLIVLGVVQKVIHGLGMKYGWVFCDRFNLHVKNHPKFPNLSPPSLVFKIKEPTKGAGSDIHMISLIGDELLTLAKFICEESMLFYITDPNDKQLVIQTLKLVSLFYRQLTDDEIKEGGYLFQQIIEFRKLFAKAFLGQQPHPDHRLKKDPNKPDKPDWTFNLRLPTLSALLTVPTLLRYLGPSKFQDTSLFESLHFEWRLAQNAVNGLRNTRDIIQLAFARHQVKRARFDGEFKNLSEEVRSLHKKNNIGKQRPDVHEFGQKIRIYLREMDPTVIASLKLTYEEIQDADLLLPVTKHEPDFSKIKFYVVSGINIQGNKSKQGSWIQLVNPVKGDNPENMDECSFIKLRTTFRLELNGESIIWMDCDEYDVDQTCTPSSLSLHLFPDLCQSTIWPPNPHLQKKSNVTHG